VHVIPQLPAAPCAFPAGRPKGLTDGPFLGYEHTADIGFTFDGQVGFQRIGLSGKASAGAQTMTDEQSEWSLLLNLNVGWSF